MIALEVSPRTRRALFAYACEVQGVTRAAAARAFGISYNHLMLLLDDGSGLWRGVERRRRPSQATADRIAAFIGVASAELWPDRMTRTAHDAAQRRARRTTAGAVRDRAGALRLACLAHSCTIADCCERVFRVSRAYLDGVLAGQRMPSAGLARRIAAFVGVPPQEFFPERFGVAVRS